VSSRLDHDVRTLDHDAIGALSDMLDGDEEALAELAQAMLDEAPERLAELRGGDVARAAHTLKSNAQTFGATELAERCRALEAEARAGAPAAASIEAVEAAWPPAKAALEALCAGARP
jgi:HPt (histidine-containing phosphotransfer) domain-containing protein